MSRTRRLLELLRCRGANGIVGQLGFPYFITNAEKVVAEQDQPCILIHEKELSGLQRHAAASKAGIIDPTKHGAADAASVAGLLVTTAAVVAERPEKKAAGMPHGGGMGDMDF